jgi:GTP-binding protein EngB required for normal cell division
MGGNIDSNNYDLNINMIGENMYLLYLFLTKSIYTDRKSIDVKEKKSIFDYWNFNYKFNTPIEQQIKYVFSIYTKNKGNIDINSKEVLIVHVRNKETKLVDTIFTELEKFKMPHYMPLVLFLSDEFEFDKKIEDSLIIPDKHLFPHINHDMIFTAPFLSNEEYIYESQSKELTEKGEYIMDKIKNILLRFCSYHNDLGDRFSIGEKDNVINYDLTEKYFPFTINICCIGRFGKGKSTCVNCLLGETKAKESKSGASTTKKINYYQISNQPIKIYDIPGFENKETCENAVQKMKELNDEMNELKDHLHFILYVIKSTDERMFADIEYNMINEISKQENTFLLYILTHSSENIDKDEKIDMINVGIKNLLTNNKCKDVNNVLSKLRASEENCFFINFHPYDNNPIHGIKELFEKLSILSKETETYKKYKKNLNKSELQKLIEEEAEIRKAKAKKVLIWNSIGAGLIGAIPGVDLAVQKLVIQKQAKKKICQIFGLDIDIILKEELFNNQNINNTSIERDSIDNDIREDKKKSNKESVIQYLKGSFSGISSG